MNKKGFTLVELLAVIALIGVISTIAVVSISGIRNKVDLKMVEGNIDLILIAAKSYGEDDLVALSTSPITKKVSELKTLTELDIDNSYNNIRVKVYLMNNRASACIVNKNDLKSIAGENNLDYFNSYYCN